MRLIGPMVRVLAENDHLHLIELAHTHEGEHMLCRWIDGHALLTFVGDEIR